MSSEVIATIGLFGLVWLLVTVVQERIHCMRMNYDGPSLCARFFIPFSPGSSVALVGLTNHALFKEASPVLRVVMERDRWIVSLTLDRRPDLPDAFTIDIETLGRFKLKARDKNKNHYLYRCVIPHRESLLYNHRKAIIGVA